MDVTILKPGCTIPLASGAEESYPVKWSGNVPDHYGETWIAEGKAERVAGAQAFPGFTEDEAFVLKAAAQQAIAVANAAAEGLTVDPETGEVVDAENTGEAARKQSPAEVLASMTFEEIKALAEQNGIKTNRVGRAKLEAALLAKIEAAAAPAA